MRLPARPQREIKEHTGPLIDMVFLLLIFFVLAGTITPPEPLPVDPPHAHNMEPIDEAQPLLLAADGRMAFEGKEIDLETLRQTLAQRLVTTAELVVELKADAAVDVQDVIELIDALRTMGIEQVLLLTTHEPS